MNKNYSNINESKIPLIFTKNINFVRTNYFHIKKCGMKIYEI